MLLNTDTWRLSTLTSETKPQHVACIQWIYETFAFGVLHRLFLDSWSNTYIKDHAHPQQLATSLDSLIMSPRGD
jgi:hypothetical protein